MKIRWHNEQQPKMKINENNGVTYLTWPVIDKMPWICHGFSTRLGGVSQGCFSSMNLSFARGDEKANVLENYNRITKTIGCSMEDLVVSHQTHTTNVRVVTDKDRGKGVLYPRDYQDVDGLVTDQPGIVLTTFYADCVPLYLIDPVHKAIGLSHSGWRGTKGRMGQATIRKMREVYGTNPKDLVVAIGPSICQDCYEVSEDVIEEFKMAFHSRHWQSLFYKKENGKYQLNLWEANRIIFMEAGVLPENIHMPDLCTCCNPDFLFSHRASGGKRGNLAAFLGIYNNK